MNATNDAFTTSDGTPDPDAILDSMTLKRKDRRGRNVGGTWVTGSIAGHFFEALVFPEHAESEAYELDDSRISKFFLRRQADRVVVANFDRGWDVHPANDMARAIVDLLAAGLAEHVFGH